MFTTTPHFESGTFTAHAAFLPDEEYGRALDCLVKGCTDMILVRKSDKKVLLGKRRYFPQSDWWFVGGRMKPGETVAQSCTRILKRELQITLNSDDHSRFRTVGHYSLVWDKRLQAPQENGTADISVVSTLELTDEEVKNIHLDENEYSDSMFIYVDDIVNGENFHPGLRRAAKDLLACRKWLQIESALNDEAVSDKQIRQLLIEFNDLKH